MMEKLAHTDETGREHLLTEHLEKTAVLAESFAESFGAGEWARCAAMWHDLGKYSDEFQAYIRSVNDPDANIENKKGRIPHSTAGAVYAVEQFGLFGKLIAYLIAGHHAGLPDGGSEQTGQGSLTARLDDGAELLKKALRGLDMAEILDLAKPSQKIKGSQENLHLWVRMLYSCLVDADFLDTESFMDEIRTRERGNGTDLSAMKQAFDDYMLSLPPKAIDMTPVNRIRADVLRQCRQAGQYEGGVFTLTVPTGGGKTLSSLAFAMEHALAYKKERIIYAIPYTSIIEQTAVIFKGIFKAFPEGTVIEHHSNLDPDRESAKSRLATENWDAPLIVTTNVQLFESLFAARSSGCRKLHNIVGSVIILDEAQLLPPEYLQPILQVMNVLSREYGVTFVLCTATQPALGTRQDPFGKIILKGLSECREIIDDPEVLYTSLKRVNVTLPKSLEPNSWEEIALQLSEHESVLAIVNTRKDCTELYRLMPEGTVHLSALMCPEHRTQVIGDIKKRLKNGENVRVVSTQLVEAGVDMDFPVVYRALAGIDSVAQAAGRCNREGKLNGLGNVRVFVPPKPAPPGLLRFGEQASREVIRDISGDLLSPDVFEKYFDRFYAQVHEFDKKKIVELLTPDKLLNMSFRTAAEAFRLIDENGSQSVIVRWGDEIEDLLKKLLRQGSSRYLMRKLGRYSVTLPKYHFDQLVKQGDIEETEGIYVLSGSLYSERTGVVLGDMPLDAGELYV